MSSFLFWLESEHIPYMSLTFDTKRKRYQWRGGGCYVFWFIIYLCIFLFHSLFLLGLINNVGSIYTNGQIVLIFVFAYRKDKNNHTHKHTFPCMYMHNYLHKRQKGVGASIGNKARHWMQQRFVCINVWCCCVYVCVCVCMNKCSQPARSG